MAWIADTTITLTLPPLDQLLIFLLVGLVVGLVAEAIVGRRVPLGFVGGGDPRDAGRVDHRACVAFQHFAGLHGQWRPAVALVDWRGAARPPVVAGDAGPGAMRGDIT